METKQVEWHMFMELGQARLRSEFRKGNNDCSVAVCVGASGLLTSKTLPPSFLVNNVVAKCLHHFCQSVMQYKSRWWNLSKMISP
mmetsp:Transcript_1665/g.3493  ORF Transcript_1665/g.3493 Transcript_1665/m.3493 type:complete len:85 (-) Transcript_1665:663-917(-)